MDDEVEQAVADDIDGWEYLLLFASVADGLAALEPTRRDHLVGYVRPPRRSLAYPNPVDVVEAGPVLAEELLALLDNLRRVMSPQAIESAVGALGEPGDPAAIRHLASTWSRGAEDFFEWANDLRAARAPEAARPILWNLSNAIDRPMSQLKEWVDSSVEILLDLVGAFRAGATPPEGFKLAVEIDTDRAVFDAAIEALNALTNEIMGTDPGEDPSRNVRNERAGVEASARAARAELSATRRELET